MFEIYLKAQLLY